VEVARGDGLGLGLLVHVPARSPPAGDVALAPGGGGGGGGGGLSIRSSAGSRAGAHGGATSAVSGSSAGALTPVFTPAGQGIVLDTAHWYN
jgi:hypothetical protein